MSQALFLLVLLNPFAQVLYLWELLTTMPLKRFASIYMTASVLSFGVFATFAITGEFLFRDVFQIGLDAFRIFGGIVILLIAIRYFTVGAGSSLLVSEGEGDLAPRISLPYQVGPGTIYVSIILGRKEAIPTALALIAIVLAINLILVIACYPLVRHVASRSRTMVGRYFNLLMRTNAFFIGAIGIEMILSGIGEALSERFGVAFSLDGFGQVSMHWEWMVGQFV